MSSPAVHGDGFPAPLNRVEGVLHPAFEWDVPGDDGDRLDPDVRVLERHDQRDGVVRGGVGVDQKATQAPLLLESAAEQLLPQTLLRRAGRAK